MTDYVEVRTFCLEELLLPFPRNFGENFLILAEIMSQISVLLFFSTECVLLKCKILVFL